jgi:hypothetical protein
LQAWGPELKLQYQKEKKKDGLGKGNHTASRELEESYTAMGKNGDV